MAKFLTGNELNAELEKIFEQAEELIVLISPFIKLHDRYISTLRAKKDNHKLEIIIVFGKNEEDFSRSMKQEDFNFFKDFPNIKIYYERRLHAKYYSNETSAILTSMNLYSFSQDNNIEAGVMTKVTILGAEKFDEQSSAYFSRVIEQSDLLFHKTPQYESAMFGLTKKYKESKIEVDKLSDFFADRQKFEATNRKNNYEKKKVEYSQTETTKPTIKAEFKKDNGKQTGYCIRCYNSIALNPLVPFCKDCYYDWKKNSNEEFQEQFCHICGEKQKTTKSKPSCYNCYKTNKNKLEFPLTT